MTRLKNQRYEKLTNEKKLIIKNLLKDLDNITLCMLTIDDLKTESDLTLLSMKWGQTFISALQNFEKFYDDYLHNRAITYGESYRCLYPWGFLGKFSEIYGVLTVIKLAISGKSNNIWDIKHTIHSFNQCKNKTDWLKIYNDIEFLFDHAKNISGSKE